ncbi:MAG: hypothetical protein ACREBT_07405, partial [Thermoplasmata archaeon]
GVRVDHVDGLADPRAYLEQLAAALRKGAARQRRRSPYLIVEKILAWDERLPATWPVGGTTGYDALARIGGVLVPARAPPLLEEAYQIACAGESSPFAEVAFRGKCDVQDTLFRGERAALCALAEHERPPGVSSNEAPNFSRTLTALTAALPTYRTYGRAGGRLGREDRRWLDRARSTLRLHQPGARPDPSVWSPRVEPSAKRARLGSSRPRSFLLHWQQYSSAVAAKGIEDTAFYRDARWIGANEVGGDPATIAVSVDEFHRFQQERMRRAGPTLTPTSTHDTKWGEDARARLLVLAELARPWGQDVTRWRRLNRSVRERAAPTHPPTKREEYRLYQTLVATAPASGGWPPGYLRRVESYLVKCAREAKEATSWLDPDLAHEEGLVRFVRGLAGESRTTPFRVAFARWARTAAYLGGYYSGAQTILRTMLPGIPDLYQGSEAWNFSMVDPDNRRPVRFDRLARKLQRAERGHRSARAPLRTVHRRGGTFTEEDKLALTAYLLRFRQRHRPLFEEGEYIPVWEATAGRKVPAVAFCRRRGSEWILVAVGRGLAGLNG